MRYELAVIGSGGGAFAAAIAARGKGRSVVMVEQGTIGGCVNTGCVPSKALLAAAEARHVALDLRFPGIATSAGAVDVAALGAGKTGLVERMRADKYVDLAADYGWSIIPGAARFVDGTTLEVSLADGGVRRVGATTTWSPPGRARRRRRLTGSPTRAI